MSGGRQGPLDRRLVRQVAGARSALAAAVGVGVATTGCAIALAVLLASVVDRVLTGNATAADVAPELTAMAAVVVLRAGLLFAGEVAAHRTSAAVTATLRRRFLEAALARGPGWLEVEPTAELAVTATRGIDALETYFGRFLPQLVLAAVAPVAVLAWVAWADWISFAVLALTVAVIPVFMVLLGLAARDRSRRQWRQLSVLGSRFLDLVQGLPTLRAFGREDDGREAVARASDDLRRSTLETLKVAFLSSLALELLASIGTALVALFLGIRLVQGTVSLGVALAVLVLAPEVYLPLRRAAAEFHASTEGQEAAGRLLDVIEDGPGAPATAAPVPPPAGAAVPDLTRAAITLHRLEVRYPGRAAAALEGLDLVVNPGEHLAVVGPSGAGKSTLLGVLLGFVPPSAGRVLVDGVDLRRLEAATWLRSLAWVPQRPYLVSGTIGENLLLGLPAAARRHLPAAVEAAGLDDLLSGLPRGLATAVGDGGTTLSVGERQRVALARAVLRDPPLLLLDEPADHLDDASEEALRQRLEGWVAHRTVVVAAHRRRLVSRVDRVVHLVDGRAVDGRAVDGQTVDGRAVDGQAVAERAAIPPAIPPGAGSTALAHGVAGR